MTDHTNRADLADFEDYFNSVQLAPEVAAYVKALLERNKVLREQETIRQELIIRIKTAHEQRDAFIKESAMHKAQAADLRKQNEELKKQNEELKAILRQRREENKQLEEEREKLKATLRQRREENKQLEEQVEARKAARKAILKSAALGMAAINAEFATPKSTVEDSHIKAEHSERLVNVDVVGDNEALRQKVEELAASKDAGKDAVQARDGAEM